MNARKLLASAAMSATLLMSLTEVAAADETRPPCKQVTNPTQARRARAARAPRVKPVVGNGKRPAYMAPAKAHPPVVAAPPERKDGAA